MAGTANKPALIIPGLGSLYERLSDFAYPLLRLTMGAVMAPHGCQKLFGIFGARPFDQYVAGFKAAGEWASSPGWVYYIGILELFGGLAMAFGLLTRFFAVQFVGFMFVATFIATWPRGYFWTAGGWECPLVWMIVCLVILVRGGGKFSVDRAIGKEF